VLCYLSSHVAPTGLWSIFIALFYRHLAPLEPVITWLLIQIQYIRPKGRGYAGKNLLTIVSHLCNTISFAGHNPVVL